MHNLHVILTYASSACEAADLVHNYILDWGDSNNWRSIGGIASEDGSDDIENYESAGWGLSFLDEESAVPKDGTYFSRAKAYVLNLITGPIHLHSTEVKCQEITEAVTAISAILASYDEATADNLLFYRLGKDFQHLNELSTCRIMLREGSELPEFYSWDLEENGFTIVGSHEDGRTRYFVFLDMHS